GESDQSLRSRGACLSVLTRPKIEHNLSGEPFSPKAHKGGALHHKQFHHQSRQWCSGWMGLGLEL
ncbi:hypothetical protein M513_02289, partial [Trichuris suis]